MAGLGGGSGLTEEEVEDIVGAMADAGHGLAYDDAAGLIAATRRGPNPYDAAETFEESELSTTLTDLSVSGGSIQIGNTNGEMVSRAPDTDTISVSRKEGLAINPNTPLRGVSGELSANTSGATTAYLTETDGTVLTTDSISGGSFTLDGVSLSEGTNYYVVADAGESDYTKGYGSESFPIAGAEMDITTGVYGTNTIDTSARTVNDLTPIVPKGSGSGVLEWDQPTDLYEWDVATYTKTLDGETVDVFVGINDGNGWQRANGGAPINRNYSLADDSDVTPDHSVRIEAELSRSDTANNPTLDSAYRSWVV